MSDKHQTWIYQVDGSAKIVDLGRDEPAPEGWSRDITVIEDESLRHADALSGIRPVADPVDPSVDGDAPTSLDAAALMESVARIAELEGVIAAGMAENERLVAELDGSNEEADVAVAEIARLGAELATRDAQAQTAADQIASLSGALETAKAENARLQDGGEIARLNHALRKAEDELAAANRRLVNKGR